MQVTFFNVKQIVHNVSLGVGEVVLTDAETQYPIEVKYEGGVTRRYTYDGRPTPTSGVVIYQVRPIITDNVPIVSFVDGELVWCATVDMIWQVRYYANNNKCYETQRKHGATCEWERIRKFEDNPFLIKQENVSNE